MSVFDELNNSALNQFELTNLNTIQVNPNIQNSSSFPQFPIPFNFTSLSTNQLANKYYNNNEVFSNSGFKVYFDEESKGIIDDTNPVQELDEVVVKAFRNARSKEFDNFKLVMFTSTDGVKILQQYKQVDVNPDEIAVFFELDNSTNVFGSVMRIKVGVNILKNENLPYREILEFATKDRNGVAINLNQNKLKRLIKKGVYKDKENLFSFVISTLTDGLSSVIQYTAGGIGNFFFTSIPKELSKLKFTDKDWDTETEGYNPFFIPSSFIEYVEKQQGKTNAEKKIIETLIKPLFNKFNGLQDDALRTLEASKALIPNKVYRKLKAFIKVILKQIKSIEEAFLDSNLGLLALIQKNAQVINAFLCGLFNSIVDFVNGIFQLIGLVFIGIKEANNFANNIGYYTSIAIEFVENIIEGIINIDFKSLLIQTLLFPLKLKNIFQAGISAFNITLEQTAYFIGFIGGFIIETIISIFFTGGALTLNKVLIKTFKEPLDFLLKTFKGAVNKASSLFEKIINVVNGILEALKNPKQLAQDILKFFEELFGKSIKFKDELDQIIDDVVSGKIKLLNNKIKGNFGEIVAHKNIIALKTVNGQKVKYKALHPVVTSLDQKITKGIDGLYINELFNPPPIPPHKYLVSEAKFNTATLSVTKSKGKQMSRKWILESLREIKLPNDEKLSRKLYRDIIKSYDPVLTKINTNGSIKSMELLDSKTNKIGKF